MAARWRHIPDLLETHRDELVWLAGQRREMLGSPRHDLRHWGEINERMEAHLQGLRVAPAAALREGLDAGLDGDERDEVFAAAWSFLRHGDAALAARVLERFATAQGGALAGLRDALSLLPPPLSPAVAGLLRQSLAAKHAARAVAAAVVLANHGRTGELAPHLDALLLDPDPQVLALAWRVLGRVDGAQDARPPARPFMAGVTHADAAVRDAAWSAAAWTGQAPALPLLRQRAQSGDVVALAWLCVLGGADETAVLQAASAAPCPPAQGCGWLARHGHPAHLPLLLSRMDAQAPHQAVAAREAFTRITGLDVRGARHRLAPPPGGDDLDAEMAPDVWMPDPARARAALAEHGSRWDSQPRWCEGRALPPVPEPADLARLDLQARWDAVHRAAWHGRRISRPPPIH